MKPKDHIALRDAEDEIFELFVELKILRQNPIDNNQRIASVEKKVRIQQALISKLKQQ